MSGKRERKREGRDISEELRQIICHRPETETVTSEHKQRSVYGNEILKKQHASLTSICCCLNYCAYFIIEREKGMEWEGIMEGNCKA